MTITTPSGHRVEIKDFLSFGDKRHLERMMTDAVKIRKTNDGMISEPFTGSFVMDVQEEAVRRMIVGITLADGTQPTGNFKDVIDSWNSKDGQFVYDEIDRLYGSEIRSLKQSAENEKKTM
jgi:hypothetical protein